MLEYYTPEPLPDEQKNLDIVARLMILLSCVDKDDEEMQGVRETVEDAAEEIERLREKIFNLETEVHFDDQTIKSLQVINERLREALQEIIKLNPFHNATPPIDKQYYAQIIIEMINVANAALKEGE